QNRSAASRGAPRTRSPCATFSALDWEPRHQTIQRFRGRCVVRGALLLARSRAPPIASTDGFCRCFSVSSARSRAQYELTNRETGGQDSEIDGTHRVPGTGDALSRSADDDAGNLLDRAMEAADLEAIAGGQFVADYCS